jgi:hypothetical protein
VRPNLAALLQNLNIFRGKLGLSARRVVLLDQVRQMQRARQSRRPRADDENVGLKLFALDGHVFIRF